MYTFLRVLALVLSLNGAVKPFYKNLFQTTSSLQKYKCMCIDNLETYCQI